MFSEDVCSKVDCKCWTNAVEWRISEEMTQQPQGKMIDILASLSLISSSCLKFRFLWYVIATSINCCFFAVRAYLFIANKVLLPSEWNSTRTWQHRTYSSETRFSVPEPINCKPRWVTAATYAHKRFSLMPVLCPSHICKHTKTLITWVKEKPNPWLQE